MAIEVGWGHIATVVSGLCGVIGTLAAWVKSYLDKRIKGLTDALDQCEEKHLQTAIELAEIKGEVKTIKDFEKMRNSFVEGVVEGVKGMMCPLKGGCGNDEK